SSARCDAGASMLVCAVRPDYPPLATLPPQFQIEHHRVAGVEPVEIEAADGDAGTRESVDREFHAVDARHQLELRVRGEEGAQEQFQGVAGISLRVGVVVAD